MSLERYAWIGPGFLRIFSYSVDCSLIDHKSSDTQTGRHRNSHKKLDLNPWLRGHEAALENILPAICCVIWHFQLLFSRLVLKGPIMFRVKASACSTFKWKNHERPDFKMFTKDGLRIIRENTYRVWR